jgi:head-tail adaptor
MEKVKEEFIMDVTADIQNNQLEEMEDINEIWNKIKNRKNEAAGKIIGIGERSQRNTWFDEECQIILEDKKRA